jgi:hypothetical protein
MVFMYERVSLMVQMFLFIYLAMYLTYSLKSLFKINWTETCKHVLCRPSQLSVGFVLPIFVVHPCAILIYH